MKKSQQQASFFQVFVNNNYVSQPAHAVPVWKVARYTCSQPPTIAEKDGYTNTHHSHHDLSTVGLSRARAFYADTQKSTHMVSSVVRLGAGEYRAAGDGGQGSESMGAEEHALQPCSSVGFDYIKINLLSCHSVLIISS